MDVPQNILRGGFVMSNETKAMEKTTNGVAAEAVSEADAGSVAGGLAVPTADGKYAVVPNENFVMETPGDAEKLENALKSGPHRHKGPGGPCAGGPCGMMIPPQHAMSPCPESCADGCACPPGALTKDIK